MKTHTIYSALAVITASGRMAQRPSPSIATAASDARRSSSWMLTARTKDSLQAEERTGPHSPASTTMVQGSAS